MATNTIEQIINQAISDFDNIEAAIEECGVAVPYGTDTSEYGNKVREVYLMAIANAKSVYNAETHDDFPSVGSEDVIYKAQAEKKIYQWNPTELQYEELVSTTDALSAPIQLVENTDSSNKVPLRSLESGTYILKGYFTSYDGGTHSYTFSTGMLVAVVKTASMTYVQIFYPKNNTIQYLEISDTSVTRKDAKLVNMETVANMVTTVDETSDDSHYPSAMAVYNAITAHMSATPDFSANEGEEGHILNRTHYVDKNGVVHKLDNKFIDADWMATSQKSIATTVIYPEQTVSSVIQNRQFNMNPGIIYDVYINGAVYACECYNEDGAYCLGDSTYETYPFKLFDYGGTSTGGFFQYDSSVISSPVTVKVMEHSEIAYNKLPEEFLPDGVVKSVNGVSPDESGNVEIGAGSGSGGLTTAQINALDGMFKIASFTEDPTTAYAAFKSAFGLSGSDSGDTGGDDNETGGDSGDDTVTYSVTNNLTGVTNSNSQTEVTEGFYSATLTVADGYSLNSVVITMGGVDITDSVYTAETGSILITEVTGDIVITATAEELEYLLLSGRRGADTINFYSGDIGDKTNKIATVNYNYNAEYVPLVPEKDTTVIIKLTNTSDTDVKNTWRAGCTNYLRHNAAAWYHTEQIYDGTIRAGGSIEYSYTVKAHSYLGVHAMNENIKVEVIGSYEIHQPVSEIEMSEKYYEGYKWYSDGTTDNPLNSGTYITLQNSTIAFEEDTRVRITKVASDGEIGGGFSYTGSRTSLDDENAYYAVSGDNLGGFDATLPVGGMSVAFYTVKAGHYLTVNTRNKIYVEKA